MANTYVDRTGDGSETEFTFPFKYIQEDHVKVKVDDVIVDKSTEAPTGYTIEPASGVEQYDKIVFNNAPANNAEIRIYRDSRGDFSPLVDFVDGSVLTQEPLDTAYLHNLYVSQEASEGTGNELLNKKGGANYDAEDNKIINLGTPTASTDAADKGYVDQTVDNAIALGGSPAIVSLGGYDVTSTNDTLNQLRAWTADIETNASDISTANIDVTSTGSTTARSLADRFSDVVNVLDFIPSSEHTYILGNDLSSQNGSLVTTGIQDACNAAAGKTVYFPSGTYKVTSTINLFTGQPPNRTGLRVRLLGAGTAYGSNQGTKLVFTPDSGDMFNCYNNYYMTVRDLGIEGDPDVTYNTSNRCFVIDTITHMKFENVTISGFSDAIVQDATSGINFHLTIDQCNINDCYYALYIKNACHLITVTNSFFSNNGFGVRINNSSNVSFKSTCIQIQGMDAERGREEDESYCFRFDNCYAVGFDNCYFEVNARDVIETPPDDPHVPGTQYLGQVNQVNGFQFKNNYVIGASNMDDTISLIRFYESAGMAVHCNTFYRFPPNLTYVSADATGDFNRHLVGRSGNVINRLGLIVDNSFDPVLYLNNLEATAVSYVSYSGSIYKCIETHTSSESETPDTSSKWSVSTDVSSADAWVSGELYNDDTGFGVQAVYGAGNVARSFFDGSTIRLVGTMVVTNWAALQAGGASTDYIGIGLPVEIDGYAHGSNDQVAIGTGYWNGIGNLLPLIEDARPNIIRIKLNDFTTNLTSGDAPSYVSFDISFKPEVLPYT